MSDQSSPDQKGKAIRPLYTQLLFVTLSFMLLVTLSGIFVNNMLSNYLKRDAESLLEQTRLMIASELREPETLMIRIVDEVRAILLGGGSREDVEEFFDHASAPLWYKTEGFIFEGFHGLFRDFEYIPAPGWTPPDDHDATTRPWYIAAIEAEGAIVPSPMYLSLHTGGYHITYVCQIFDDNGDSLGVTAMNVSLSSIMASVTNTRLTENGYGFLTNENLELIAHPDPSYISKRMDDISPGFRRVVQLIEQGESITELEEMNYQNIRSIFYCKPIDKGWYLGLMTPRDEYYKDFTNLVVFLGILGLVMAGVVCGILIRIDRAGKKLKKAFKEKKDELSMIALLRTTDEKNMLASMMHLLNSLDSMIYVTNPDTDEILFINDTMRKNLNIESDCVGQLCYKVLRRYKGVRCELCPCDKLDRSSESVIVWEDYSELTHRSYRNSARYIDWPDGKRVHLQHSVDMTEHMLLLTKLKLAIAGNRLALWDMDIIYDDPLNPENIAVYSDEFRQMIGFEDENDFPNVLGSWIGCLHPDDKEMTLSVLLKHITDKTGSSPFDGEYRLRKKNGEYGYFHASGKTFRNRDGIPLRVAGTLRDITERHQIRENLKRREELLRAVHEMAIIFLSQYAEAFEDTMTKGLLVIADAIGLHRLSIWQNFEMSDGLHSGQIYRWDRASGGTTPPTKNLADLMYAKHAPMWREYLEKGESINALVSSLPQNTPEAAMLNQFHVKSVFITPIFFEGSFWGFGLFEERINERLFDDNDTEMMRSAAFLCANTIIMHKKSEDLQAALTEAQEANRAKSNFLANMSHEIRTPMNAILGITEIQLRDESLSPAVEEGLEKVYESGNLLLNLINDMLDLSKIEADKLEIVPMKYDIPSLINDCVQLNRLHYSGKPIEFFLDIDENTPVNLIGDELRLKQILNNVLSNAYKYTDTGEVKLFVRSEPTDDEETVTMIFKVTDTGQGMTDEQLNSLFDEYSRFNIAANRTTVGTGLGMSITKRLLDMMDGRITIKSEVNKGTELTLYIPQKRVGTFVCGKDLAEKLRTFHYQSTTMSSKAQVLREYMPYGRVLIVDDVESNIYVINGMLFPYGLKVESASSGFEAIDKIKKGNEYDIIFMDHMMPRMDGIEATKLIREMKYEKTIVALTANAIVGQSEIFMRNGFDGFLAKPIDSRELNQMLNYFIRDKQPPDVLASARKNFLEQRINKTSQLNPPNDLARLEKFFVLDAKNALNVLESFCKKTEHTESEMELYEVTVHGMKSALANIGKNEFSEFAYKLEQAARDNDHNTIKSKTPMFANMLKALIKSNEKKKDDGDAVVGDAAYLSEKLSVIVTACEVFDKKTAKAALDDLMRKQWSHQVSIVLDEINLHLLHSAFKKAAASAKSVSS